ncbi:hypothetical protein GCM10010913_42760 [Paenibacillus aceti]|uniref:DUF2508 domain-containing protein n=2 Tax=Paenibacillus aceti TaxID=1820010 RepID=A0ABQ1W6L3_9BACL|nr:hypothetical protein GCM10010913_42760 [Paenibacillus aceti]
MIQRKMMLEGLLNFHLRPDQEDEYKRMLYQEVNKARKEWEQAYMAFQQAVGEANVDVAIYTLEAAERRYQIELKRAKQADVKWDAFRQGSYFD